MSEENHLYHGERSEILKFIPEHARRILDIGCSSGDLGAAIKRRRAAVVVGIEINANAARIATGKLDAVFVGDVGQIVSSQDLGVFDVIIFADVIEHLTDPGQVIRSCVERLSPDGIVIFSIPNVSHVSVLADLFFHNEWKYRDCGILDRTHLRFFTDRSFSRLLEASGLTVTQRDHVLSFRGSRLLDRITCGLLRRFLTAQYLFIARCGVASSPGLKSFDL